MNKIGIFIDSMKGGGAERVVLNLANEFENRKIPLVLILRFKDGPYLSKLDSNIIIHELHTNNPLLIIIRLIKTCKKNKIKTLLTVSMF